MDIKNWKDLKTIPMFDLVSRKSYSGKNITAARVELGRGSTVPGHRHPNEQMTVILSGSLIFSGEKEEKNAVAGDIVYTPAEAYHAVTALEDSVVLDIFSPIRSDWSE